MRYIIDFIEDILGNLSKFLPIGSINIILRFLYIPLVALAILLLIMANKYNKSKKIRLRRGREIRTKVKTKQPKTSIFLRLPIAKMADAISFTNSLSTEANEGIAMVIMLVYGLVSIVIYRYLGTFSFLWYTKFVNIIIALFLPYALIHTYISIQINTITKQIPNAFSEILSSYRSDKRIKNAIDDSLSYMDKHIKREFKRINVYLGSESTFEYGLDRFSKRLDNSYVTLFCTLVKESRYKSGDITEALEKLVIKTRTKNYMKEKARRELVFYRVFLIGWLFTIPAIMKFVSSASLEAYQYYGTVDGAKILTMAMLSIVIGYLLIMLMERN